MTDSRPDESEAPFDYEGLDRVLHEKARLGILPALSAARNGRSFPELKDLCGLTDGNLNRHLAVLHDAGLVTMRKKGRGRGGQTTARLSAAGRRAFHAYLEELERVLRDARAREIDEAEGGPTGDACAT